MRLQNKTALVTGAARGIGEAISAAFAREGARVVLTDIDEAGAGAAARRLGQRAERLDVREEADWRRVVDGVLAREGRLDILVNNAGVTGFEGNARPHDPEHASLEDWRAVHAVNLDGVFLGCKHGVRAMRKTGAGSIINISSRSGLVGIPGACAYASSKAGIRNHTKSVALYCAGEGLNIRCNSIHPAAILTPMWEPMLGTGPDREARMKEIVAEAPMKRFGTPDEVAAIAVLLASDEAAYMTGAELTIDGGILAGSAAAPSRE
jgi:NAD(P)-dependent dehydrogenase (short-subunit alcohol dehydrogenase family)